MVANWFNTKLTRIKERPFSPYGLLAGITLLAAALRFFKLGEWSFWIDEIFTIGHAQQHYGSLELILENIPPARNWVPVSVILTAQSLNLFGVSEWSARLASAIIGTISIPILYFPIKKIFDNQVALIALLLLAVSPWHLFWSQNARFYANLLLFYTLALTAFYYGAERNQLRYFVLFFALLYLAFSERLFAFFIVPVMAGYLIALWILKYERPPGLNPRNILLLGSPIIIGGLVELYTWIFKGESRFFGDFGWFFLYQNEDPLRLLISIIFNVSLPIFSMALIGGFYLLLRKNRAGLFLLISALLPVATLVFLNPFMFTKDRYVFMTLPGWLILTAIAIKELVAQARGTSKLLALGVLVVFLAHSAGTNLLYYHVNKGNRLDWRAAFEFVKERSQAQDVVVAWWPEFGPFYLDAEIVPWENVQVETIIESDRRHWFVVDYETVWGNIPLKNWLEAQGQLVEVFYLRQPEDDYYLRIYLYDPVKNSIEN